LGEEILQKSVGYWTDATIVDALKESIQQLGRFPTQQELCTRGRTDILNAIRRNGGLNKFRELCGYLASDFEKYRAEIMSYIGKRGKKTERLVEKILIEYCVINNLTRPKKNIKLSRGNIIEFVCETNKKIGIDVTNSDALGGITRKYRHKEYYKHLDELWIVVFSSVFRGSDILKMNKNAELFLQERNESPNKVWIMLIDDFIDELNISASLDSHTRNNIKVLNECTFRTKEDYMNRLNERISIQSSLDIWGT
jgi:hypothetical protein